MSLTEYLQKLRAMLKDKDYQLLEFQIMRQHFHKQLVLLHLLEVFMQFLVKLEIYRPLNEQVILIFRLIIKLDW